MNELIQLRKGEAVTTSLIVSESFNKRHSDVIRSIENIINNERKIASVDDWFKESHYEDNKGESRKMYYLNERGFSLLVMGFTGQNALEWKVKYIEAFEKMKQTLSERVTQAWIETRHQSKLTRKAETDVLKKFVEYAEESGSGNTDKYYVIFSKLANKSANITNRDLATTFQLNSLTFIESIILHTIECQLKLGTEYHEIYQLCKKAIDDFKDLTAYETLLIDG